MASRVSILSHGHGNGISDSLREGHVNNVRYNYWAESARVNWIENFANQDALNHKAWSELLTPRGDGLILKSIKTYFKFVGLEVSEHWSRVEH